MSGMHIVPFGSAGNPNGPVTMSSREIAELLGSRHDNVKVTIERLVNRGTIPSPAMQDFKNINGVTGKEYLVGERESYIVVAQLSPEFTAKLVDFWQKHRDTPPALPDFTNPAIAARAWADEVEKRQIADLRAKEAEEAAIQSSEQLAIAAPKAEALDRLATADGSLCITDAAKTLQVRPKELFAFLRSHGWIYRRAGSDHDVAYQPKLASGLLEHKTTTVYRSDGTEKVTTQVRVTPRGLARLAREFPPIVEAA